MTYFPSTNFWFWVVVTFASKETGATTTYRFINQAPLGETTVEQYHALLLSAQNIGTKIGELLPEPVSGTVMLKNTPGSFMFERRVSDLLDRYTVVGQDIAIYDAATAQDVTAGPTAGTARWAGKMVRATVDVAAGTMTIYVAGQPIPKKVLTKQVYSAHFTAAPAASIGKHIPIVFGEDTQVKPLRISADGASQRLDAYATTLGTQFGTGGVQQFYAKDYLSQYRPASGAATTTTHLYGNNYSGNTIGNCPMNPDCEFCYAFTTGTSPYIITNGIADLYFTVAAPIGVVSFSIYDSDGANGAAGTRLCRANVAPGVVASGVGYHTMRFSFDKAAILQASRTYYFAWGIAGGVLNEVKEGLNNSASATRYIKYKTEDQNGFDGSSSANVQCFSLYGVVFTDVAIASGSETDADGMGHAYFAADQRAAGTLQVNPSLDTLDLIVAIDGMKDNGSGTITGSASSIITNPAHAAKLMDYEWNGSSWVSGKFDITAWSSLVSAAFTSGNRYYRKIQGRTDGRTTFEDWLEEICRNLMMRVGLHNSTTTPLDVWPMGGNGTSVATIPDDDATIESIEFAGTETIVNNLKARYNRGLTTTSFFTPGTDSTVNEYQSTLTWRNGTNSTATHLTSVSATVYGQRELAEISYNWIGDSSSMESVAALLLAYQAQPMVYVRFTVPYLKYNTLLPLQVVTLSHPDMPNFFGTSPNAKLPTYSTSTCDLLQGHHWRRAKPYRVLLEERTIDWIAGNYPAMTLGGRLLINGPQDPT